MKTIIKNIQITTAEFSLFGKILTYSILAGIIFAAGKVAYAVLLTNQIITFGY